jgi:hypothetical protein
MMFRGISFVLAVLAMSALAMPLEAVAQPDDGVEIARSMRQFGDLTSGQRIGGGEVADKVLAFGRNTGGELVVTQIEILAVGGEWNELPAGAVAAMRTRVSTSEGNSRPEQADLDLAVRAGIPIFIVGEWSSPPVIWEIRREGTGAAVREIDSEGVAGPWRTPAR